MGLSPRSYAYGANDPSWRVSRDGKGVERSVRLDVSTFTPATHYPEGYLPSGIPLARVTTTGAYGLYDGDATDGRGTLAGFLAETVHDVRPDDEDRLVPLMWRGVIRPGLLPFAVDPAGLADVAAHVLIEKG